MANLEMLKCRIIGHLKHPQDLIMEYSPIAMKRQLEATQKLIKEYFSRIDIEIQKKNELYRSALDVIYDNQKEGD